MNLCNAVVFVAPDNVTGSSETTSATLRARGEQKPGPTFQVSRRPNKVCDYPTIVPRFSHSSQLRFIDSEADLDAALKSLLPLAQSPIIAYPELAESGTIEILIGLLAHENADIVIDVVEVIHELTDEDAGNEGQDEDDVENNQEALRILIEHLVSVSCLNKVPCSLSCSWQTQSWNS